MRRFDNWGGRPEAVAAAIIGTLFILAGIVQWVIL